MNTVSSDDATFAADSDSVQRETPAAPSAAVPAQPATAVQDERLLSILAHLSAIVLPIIGPIVLMNLGSARSVWLDQQIKSALNFQINAMSWIALLFVANFSLGILTFGLAGLCLMPMLLAVAIAAFVLPLVAAHQTSQQVLFTYPLTITFVR